MNTSTDDTNKPASTGEIEARFASLLRAAQHVAEERHDQRGFAMGGILAEAARLVDARQIHEALFLVTTAGDLSEQEHACELDWAVDRLLSVALRVFVAEQEHAAEWIEAARHRANVLLPIIQQA